MFKNSSLNVKKMLHTRYKQLIKKSATCCFKGLIASLAIAVLGLLPSISGQAKEQNILGSGGISSFLSVLGNSYDVDTIDSDIMGMVVNQAEELDIDFDISQYENEYANFAIANVDSYVNVREQSNTNSSVVGHMYDGSVCEILEKAEEEDGVWFKVVSGNVEGYVRSDYFIYGPEALENIEEYVKKVAVVYVNTLNVRAEASTDASVIGSVKAGDKLDVCKDEDGELVEILNTAEEELAENPDEREHTNWVKVNYTSSASGYVSLDYVVIEESYVTAKTLEEEEAEARARREAEAARQAAAAAAAANNSSVEDTTISLPNTNYGSNSELRNSIIEYASQFLGTRYVMGGQSLTNGTDCSGFTCYVYAAFGYSIGRTPSSQWANAGRTVSADELQIGDIVCFGRSSCYHVGLYIGNGQVIHEANSRLGCCISGLNFEPVLGYKNVID